MVTVQNLALALGCYGHGIELQNGLTERETPARQARHMRASCEHLVISCVSCVGAVPLASFRGGLPAKPASPASLVAAVLVLPLFGFGAFVKTYLCVE